MPSDSELAEARTRMVEEQLVGRGIRDPRVLAAMREVPRHRFAPQIAPLQTYYDRPWAIGHDQTISQPFIVGLMTQALALRGDERVLEVGTGSGYQAAVLAELAHEVYTIEIVEPLAKRAAATLAELDYSNVHTRVGDGHAGWPEAAPFDAIIVTAAPPAAPPRLLEQLATHGRLVVPLGEFFQELVLYRNEPDGLQREPITSVRFVPMTGDG